MRNKLYLALMIMILMVSVQLSAEVVTLNFKDVSIRQVFKIVCMNGKVSGVIHKVVRKRITIRMTDRLAEEVLQTMADDNGLVLTKVGEVYFMYDPKYPVKGIYDYKTGNKTDLTEEEISENLECLKQADSDIRYTAKVNVKDIKLAMAEIAAKAGKEFKTDRKFVVGYVSFVAFNAPLADIFTAVALANGYRVKSDANAWLVGYGNKFGSR